MGSHDGDHARVHHDFDAHDRDLGAHDHPHSSAIILRDYAQNRDVSATHDSLDALGAILHGVVHDLALHGDVHHEVLDRVVHD